MVLVSFFDLFLEVRIVFSSGRGLCISLRFDLLKSRPRPEGIALNGQVARSAAIFQSWPHWSDLGSFLVVGGSVKPRFMTGVFL